MIIVCAMCVGVWCMFVNLWCVLFVWCGVCRMGTACGIWCGGVVGVWYVCVVYVVYDVWCVCGV